MIGKILKKTRVIILIFFIVMSLTTIYYSGIKLGLDLQGGTWVKLELERPASDAEMLDIVKTLQTRLNALGVADVTVRAWGNDKVLVEVAGADPRKEESVIKILQQQGVFEARIDGLVVIYGDEIVRVDPYRLTKPFENVKWEVPFTINSEAAERFQEVGGGKVGHPVDLFLDRPENSIILVTPEILPQFEEKLPGETNALSLRERIGDDISVISTEELEKLQDLKDKNKVIIVGNEEMISKDIEREIEKMGFKLERKIDPNEKYDQVFLRKTVLGFLEWPTLQFDPAQSKTNEFVISGTAPNQIAADSEARETKTILQSGALPISTEIAGKSFVSPTLGREFVRQILIAGFSAILVIAAVIFLRYKKPYIAIPILITSTSEAIIILGFASLINWNIDLASIAGIVAAIGTGVDHQIVITDETITGEKVRSVTKRISHAFFIIFVAAATTIAAMTPLAYLGLGTLKGFAITTIMGVLIGIFITRPAYAQTISIIVKERRGLRKKRR